MKLNYPKEWYEKSAEIEEDSMYTTSHPLEITNTSEIEFCDNRGCVANKDGKCLSTVGECYGYMPIEK